MPAEVLVDAGGVPGVPRLRDLRRVPEHGQERQLRALRDGGTPPHVVEPERARVLDQHLLVRELLGQPLGEPLGVLLGRPLLGQLGDLGPGVERAEHRRPLEQALVEVDHPLGLEEAARVGLVGGHLGLGEVQPEHAQRARRRAGAAAPGTRDHDQPGHSDVPPPRSCGPSRGASRSACSCCPAGPAARALGQHRRLLLVGGERGRGGVHLGVRRVQPVDLGPSPLVVGCRDQQAGRRPGLLGELLERPGTVSPSQASADRLRLGVMNSSTACGAVRSPVSMPSCLQARLIAARQSSTRS